LARVPRRSERHAAGRFDTPRPRRYRSLLRCRSSRRLPQKVSPLPSRTPYRAFATFYFAQFAILGIYLPYFPLYLRSLHLTGPQIGVLMALAPVSRFLFPAFWGLWADRLGHRKPLIVISLAGSAVVFSLFFWVREFSALATVMFLYGFLLVPALPLVEALVQEEVEEKRAAYGRVRLWGSVGFIGLTLVFGLLLDRGPLRSVLIGILALSLFGLFAGLALPAGAPPGMHPRRSLRKELRRLDLSLFLTATALMQASHCAYYVFYSIHLDRLGFSRSAIGGFWTLAVGAEVLMMLGAGSLLAKFGTPRLLSLCLALAALRWGILAGSSAVWLLAGGQLLHAFTFGLFHVCAVGHTHRMFPPALRSSGQSFYSSLTYGLGSLIGFFGSAGLVDRIGIRSLFGLSAAVALLALLLSLRLWTRGVGNGIPSSSGRGG